MRQYATDWAGRALDGYWGRRAAGVIIFERERHRLLLLLRSESVENPEVWGIPGGKIDQGEKPLDALRREVAEEVGKFNADPNTLTIVPQPVHVWQAPDADFTFTTYVGFVDYAFNPQLNWENTDSVWETLDAALSYPPGFEQDAYHIHPNVHAVLRLLHQRLRWPSRRRPQVTPRRFYVSIPFDPLAASGKVDWAAPHYVELQRHLLADVDAGRLRGIASISDTSRNVLDWFGLRDAMLVMDGPETLRINTNQRGQCLYRLQYENPHFLVHDDMAILERLFNARSDSKKQRKEHIYSNILDYIKQAAQKNYDAADLFRRLIWHGGCEYMEEMPTIQTIYDLAQWLRDRAMKVDKLRLSQALSLKLVTDALLHAGRLYKSEGEWLVKRSHGCDAELLVPPGSSLFIKVDEKPENSEARKHRYGYARDVAKYEWVRKHGLERRYRVAWVRESDLSRYQKVMWSKK